MSYAVGQGGHRVAGRLPRGAAGAGQRPRCGRVMMRFEAVHGPLLDDVLCGRPAGHNGPHRSAQALARAVERDRKRWPAAAERRRQKRRRAVLADAAGAGYRAGWRKRREGRAA